MRRIVAALAAVLACAGCAQAVRGEARGPAGGPPTKATTATPGATTTRTTASPAAGPQAGECIRVTSAGASNADIEKIDCIDRGAVFKIAKRLASATADCPTADYEKYTETGGLDDFALCLMLNARDGDCFADYDDPAKRARVDCAKAEVKVVKVVGGKADDSVCPADSAGVVYPEPPTTFCLAQP